MFWILVGPLPDVLQQATVKIISNADCQASYNNLGVTIKDNMICAAAPGISSCFVTHFFFFFILCFVVLYPVDTFIKYVIVFRVIVAVRCFYNHRLQDLGLRSALLALDPVCLVILL